MSRYSCPRLCVGATLMVVIIMQTTTTTAATYSVMTDENEASRFLRGWEYDGFDDIRVVFRANLSNTVACIKAYPDIPEIVFNIPRNDISYNLIFHRKQEDNRSGYVLESSLVEGDWVFVAVEIQYLYLRSDNPVTWIYDTQFTSYEELVYLRTPLDLSPVVWVISALLVITIITSVSLAGWLWRTTHRLRALQASVKDSSPDHPTTTTTISLSGPPAIPSAAPPDASPADPPADTYYQYNLMNQNSRRGFVNVSENSLYGVVMW